MSRKKPKAISLTKFSELQTHLNKEQVDWRDLRDASVKQRSQFKPLNRKQEIYVNAIKTGVLTFAIGCAGTGKDHCAVATACELLTSGKIEKIVITRPSTECGKTLGYRPGDSFEKMLPLVSHIIDMLDEFLGESQVKRLIEQKKIIVAPISEMRGSNFHNSFILVTESQNLTWTEAVMIVTRIGRNAYMVMNGDVSQSDLGTRYNDFARFVKKLSVLPEIAIIRFTVSDVVRSGIVKRILEVLEEKD